MMTALVVPNAYNAALSMQYHLRPLKSIALTPICVSNAMPAVRSVLLMRYWLT